MTSLWILFMILAQAINAGVNIIYKMAYNIGFSLRIMVVYRFCIATAFILPFTLIVDRGKRPNLTWKIAVLSILAGVFGGVLGQNLFAESFVFASATYVAAISNLSPAITYVLALIFRMETFTLTTWPGRAKLAGTIISISGAMVITFYNGLVIHLWSTSVDLLQHPKSAALSQLQRPAVGAVLAFSSCICFSMFLIILTKMNKTYSYPVFSSLFLMCGSSTVLSTIYAVAKERTWYVWHLELDMRLIAIFYSGILASGLSVVLVAWCTRQQGPIFVSVFSPFSLIFTALLGSLLLHEEIHLGSVVGGFLVIIGVYITVWGKIIEARLRRNNNVLELGRETGLRRNDAELELVQE